MPNDPGSAPGLDTPRSPLPEESRVPKASPRVVGIGASAGGLQAFTEFLQHMPPDSGLAFVLIQHLDPQQPSYLPELLSAQTQMPVDQISDLTLVEANHVYLIPPNTALTIKQGQLHLELPAAERGQRLPIDHFFHSLAVDQGAQAVGIVLSGTGADGTEGLTAIREHGGLTLAQTPTSAAYSAMPQAAIERGVVDHILELAAMPALLLASNPSTASPPPVAPPVDTFRLIVALLHQASGHDFSHYKRTTLQRRIDRRMQLLHLPSLEAYFVRLQQDRDEGALLFQDLLIGVTEFFRDPAACEALAPNVIAGLLRSRDASAPLRVWVPGCASGEEAYSIAIILREQLAQLDTPPPIQIFATDIDEAALAVARTGWYDARIVAHVSPERLSRYFVPEGAGYKVNKALRELCLFSVHNLISDPPFGRMDLITCRNLLIYFDTDLQRQLIPVFHYALSPGGYLFLGSAESAVGAIDPSELFRVIDSRHRIYQRKERSVHPQIALPWASARRPPMRISGTTVHQQTMAPSNLGATIERILMQDYTPTALAVDPQGIVAYLSGQAYPYLSVPPGEPTANLFEMAHPDLRLPLRTTIRAVSQTLTPVVREDLTLRTAEGQRQLTLTVQPFPETRSEGGLLLVVLQASRVALPQLSPVDQTSSPMTPADALTQELQRTRETLESTINELQETNVDLTAANEELRSLNEELQATNEEQQTAKEEIQSINEELQTVNAELSSKIIELDRANADLANLFASAQIPAIFLSQDSRITRFTPQATELFALIESDIGRPLSDLRTYFHHDNLPLLITRVLQTVTAIEEVIHQPERDRWWSMHIRPYHTLAGTVDGVVLTFADISTLKQAEAVLQNARNDLEKRVTARTDELALTNVALQAQVAARTRGERTRQRLLQQLLMAQEEERSHIARELHDQMGQDLTALILGLKALQDRLSTDNPSAERVTQLQTMAMQISQEIRNLAVQLRPSVLDDLGIILALRNYVEQWSARTHVAVDLHTSGLDESRLPLAVETTIYRLVQEGLTNVLKHAKASEVSIIIERDADRVRVIIEDDGLGFNIPANWDTLVGTQQLGLIGMRERVKLLGGNMTIESEPGSGTRIFALIPLPAAIEGDSDDADLDLPGQ
ncbi:chemotaxis protein CheB [Candidatus Chloroploca sp. Khr17]|uniref:chemotaxis protein CheB n=1 Tax=Candidatus Chloroploca sp. Khr17 TaxID=2496869 RepID=UPI00101CCDA3|nr:chemotaxis protein CheB [Candidatus Chloroploca sp. Khr17]